MFINICFFTDTSRRSGWILPSVCQWFQGRRLLAATLRTGSAARQADTQLSVTVRATGRSRLHHPEYGSRQRQLAHQIRTAEHSWSGWWSAAGSIATRRLWRRWW